MGSGEEIAAIIQRPSLAVNQMKKEERDEMLQRISEAVNKMGSGEEIAAIIQRLSLAVNQMKKEERDEMLQRISEAKSLDDIIKELNRNDQMLAMQGQEQEQERVQQRPSLEPEKRNWPRKSGQVEHCQHQLQEEQRDQHEQEQQDLRVQEGKEGQQQQEGQGYGLFGFLISMFLLLPLASAKCSTCLGEGCYDTGQCILGCVPGYMNQYCDKACPSNCLNNVCLVNTTSATITCTDGCKAGYCGTKCTRPCPEGCVTCDRQCGSCNKTPCPERHYEEGCRSVCSQTYEKCDRETGQCIKCRRGYYGDNCDTKCPKCIPEGKNLVYKCFSGCKLCQDQEDNTFLMVVILGVVIILLVISGIICVLRSIRRNKKSSEIGNADKKERESLTGVINHSD